MKHLLSVFVIVSSLFISSEVRAQAPNFQVDVSKSCWYEVDGKVYFRMTTNRPFHPIVPDATIYINIPGSGWTGMMTSSYTYPHPTDPNLEVHIFDVSQNGYVIPTPYNDCYSVFVHPDMTIMDPQSFGDIFNICRCEEDCNASIKATYYGQGYAVTLEPANHPWNPNDPNSYTWNFGDGTGNYNIHSWSKLYPGPGQYTVCLTIDNGTSVCTECIQICLLEEAGDGGGDGGGENKPGKNSLSLNEPKEVRKAYYVYPNPSEDNFILQVNSQSDNEEVNIVLVDMTGRILLEQSKTINQGIQKIEINTQHLPAGVYHLKASSRTSGSFVSMVSKK